MAVKRDYGSFAKASRRVLAGLVVSQGYAETGNGFFSRAKSSWLEGFALQQTQYGDGSFCINMGIQVPAMGRRWLMDDSTDSGFDIWFRLSARGADEGDAWLPASNKLELVRSLEKVAGWLPLVEPWFAQFQTMSDVARIYRERTNLVAVGENEWSAQLAAATYGFLLAEASEIDEARKWLLEAERLMARPVYFAPGWPGILHEKVKGARLQKPTADEIRQLEAVRVSLAGL